MTHRHDEPMLALLAIERGRLVPTDAGDLSAEFDFMPPLPIPRNVFDRLESTGLLRVVADDRAELTGRGRGQLNAWLARRGRLWLRKHQAGAKR